MSKLANNIAYSTAVGTATTDDLCSMIEMAQENDHVDDHILLLFDRAQVAVGVDSTASLFITPHRYADTGETAIIGTFRADTAPMNAAVVKASGITA